MEGAKDSEQIPDVELKFLSNNIKKNALDDREYRYLELPNEMKVLLIYDKDVETTGCSLLVNSGSLCDPKAKSRLTRTLFRLFANFSKL